LAPVSIEAHVTLSHPPHAEPALRAWLAPRAMKLTSIELSQGAWPRQTMITAWREGPLEAAILDAHAIRAGLAPLGIAVSRIKVEVVHAPGAALVPALYLEHHVKVRTSADRLTELGQLGAAHGAHLSRNALRRLDGFEERFLTQRFPASAALTAEAGLRALLEALHAASAIVAAIERERVVHDDNLSLDAGWRPELSP
jgi:hypothetical protein